MKFYVLFDNIAEKLVDVFLANNDDEAKTRVDNQLSNIEHRLGNKFKYNMDLYLIGEVDLTRSKSLKTFRRK